MAAKLLVDTDVLIEHLRGSDPAAATFERLVRSADVSIFYSPVSKAEIYAGMRKGEEEKTANLFRLMRPVTIEDRVGEAAGRYLKQYRQSHGLELGDALQAACAVVFGVQLWTLNRKHFPMADIEIFPS